MSEKPISVGDLVQVVRPAPCCGNTQFMGHVYRVLSIRHDPKSQECFWCRRDAVEPVAYKKEEGGHFLSMLKRIPPLDDLKGVSEDARRPKTTEEFMKLVEEMQRQIREVS